MHSFSSDSWMGQASLEEYVRGISAAPVLDPDDARALVCAARGGDAAALERLIESHLRYVVDVALERRGQGVPLVSLIEAGNRGLARAARRWDPAGGDGFLPYALWWIRREMGEAVEVA